MNKLLKFRQTDDRRVLWVSDTHLNHAPKWQVPIWEMRGYNSAQHHTDSIIDAINQAVRPNDVLMHAGDFCLNTEENGLNELLSRIRCQNIYMLWGNHNNPLWRVYQREVKKVLVPRVAWENEDEFPCEAYPFKWKNVVFVGNYLEMTVDGHYFVVEHYPIHVWNYLKDGAKMICGHSHCALPFSSVENAEAKILDIGWDGYKRVLMTEDILAIMNKKNVYKPGDHHVRD
jgi:calcineurin-like phosphoesterase family protein